MGESCLDNLEPQAIWKNFEEITKIYRPSGYNQKISNYLKERLEKAGFQVEREADKDLNAGISEENIPQEKYTITATRNVNKQEKNAIILQAHMDMVGKSIPDDPELAKQKINDPKKPIKLSIVNDDWLIANNRTLGADNGIGLAAILAIADDPGFRNLPLEVICTTDEETSMLGAKALSPDKIYGRKLINLDAEDISCLIVGCAGSNIFKVKKDIPMEPLGNSNYREILISMDKAEGGHSGVDIRLGRINTIRTLLQGLAQCPDAKISSINGGHVHNSIPNFMDAKILVPLEKADEITNKLTKIFKENKTQYSKTDPNLEITVEQGKMADPETQIVAQEFQNKLIKILGYDLDNGVISVDKNCKTITSQNLGVLRINAGKIPLDRGNKEDNTGKIHLDIMIRSSDTKEGPAFSQKVSSLLHKLFGEEIKSKGFTGIWLPKQESLLVKAAIDAYKKVFPDKTPNEIVAHGGLEPPVFINKVPDMHIDSISIGPTIKFPHSCAEMMKISTVASFYNWLSTILDSFKGSKIKDKT